MKTKSNCWIAAICAGIAVILGVTLTIFSCTKSDNKDDVRKALRNETRTLSYLNENCLKIGEIYKLKTTLDFSYKTCDVIKEGWLQVSIREAQIPGVVYAEYLQRRLNMPPEFSTCTDTCNKNYELDEKNSVSLNHRTDKYDDCYKACKAKFNYPKEPKTLSESDFW